jgi:predicted RNase H-like HicB family nuclease
MNNRPLKLTARIWLEGNVYVSQCLEFDIASCGETPEEALENLREAVELYFEPPTATIPVGPLNRWKSHFLSSPRIGLTLFKEASVLIC